jgi:hypothetical protein
MKTIELTQGKVTQVSDERFEELSKYEWHADLSSSGKTWYAKRTVQKKPPVSVPAELEVAHV